MIFKRTFRYRLRLTKEQEIEFSKWAGCCRYVFNYFLNQRIETYEKNKKSLNYVDQANELVKLKKEKEWLKEPFSQSLQQTLKDLNQAFQNFFRRVKSKEIPGFPKFKKKGINDSFRIMQFKKDSFEHQGKRNYIMVPKIGRIEFIKSREIEGRIKHINIKKIASKWYISFNSEIEKEIKQNFKKPVGIDRGISNTIVTSNEEFFKLPEERYKKIENRIKKVQKRISKKKKQSKNFKKTKKNLSKLYNQLSCIRNDFLHKVTLKIAKNHGLIFLEKLKIKSMSKSAKGTKDKPGNNVKVKSFLNRAILKQGWQRFEVFLEYKAKYYGSKIEYVDPKNTSQKCPKCNYIDTENRKTQSSFKCLKCKYEGHADIVGALNIKYRGARGKSLLEFCH
jgi:putative transposase